MNKAPKISHRNFYNDRLQKVSFHGHDTFPLYHYVTYRRVMKQLKSALFYLYLLPRNAHLVSNPESMLSEIEEQETQLFNFILSKLPNNFNQDTYKAYYLFYTTDITSEIEAGFIDYLKAFFQHKNLPIIADSIEINRNKNFAFDFYVELSKSLLPELLIELNEYLLHEESFYIPLLIFLHKSKLTRVITRWDWEYLEIDEDFNKFIKKHYPPLDGEAYKHFVKETIDGGFSDKRPTLK